MSDGAASTGNPTEDGQADLEQSDFAPPSTPQELFRLSNHIHKDRHIFLGRAYLSVCAMRADEQRGDFYYYNSATVRLPSLSKVSISLDVFHTPPQRRFNESINTYVDTRKRIRIVQCVEDFERRSVGGSPLPNVEKKKHILAGDMLRTKSILKPQAEDESQLPPLKSKLSDLSQTNFPFKLHKEGTAFNFLSRMPTRFTIKPMSLWRQKTDTFLYGRKLNMQSRMKIQAP